MVTSVKQTGQDLNDYLDLLRNKAYLYKRDLESNDEEVTARILADIMQNKGARKKGLIILFTKHNSQCRERVLQQCLDL